jgi:hypothetical protein
MEISIGAPNLFCTLSKNAYDALSLLRSNNGTNSDHLEKCLMMTKTYKLCWGVRLNGLVKFKLNQYPSPIIGKGYKWSIGAFKDVHMQSHTIHQANKLLNLQLHPLPLVPCLKENISLLNPKMAQLLVSILNKTFMLCWVGNYSYSSIYPHL